MKLQLHLRFSTSFGQSLWISKNGELSTDLIKGAIPMTYMNEEFWEAVVKIDKKKTGSYNYRYILRNADGELVPEAGNDRVIEIPGHGVKEINVIDTWNHAGEYENAFYTTPFTNVFLKTSSTAAPVKTKTHYTHIFKIKAPLLQTNECICMGGSSKALGGWSSVKPLLFTKKGNWWIAKVDLSGEEFPIAYKYGVYTKKEKWFERYEAGDNRMLFAAAEKKKLVVLHDGFAQFSNNTWKGAGVAIPVFSLRSRKSFGVGEFTDLKLLADWAKITGLKLIQILPVNDSTANNNWSDSYPYAAISAFALHPVYINLEKTAGKEHAAIVKSYARRQKELNALADVDYLEVMKVKLAALKEIYQASEGTFFQEKEFKIFLRENKHWLLPYAAFCYLRDEYQTADFSIWKNFSSYNKKAIEKLSTKNPEVKAKISFHYFVQYHLHRQLKEAVDHCHKKGVVLKGDIPIGVYRNGCDTWVDPDLYNMDWQAGAPPDDFAVKGQNWGFPTYNWKKMQKDQFDWWRKRFEQMGNYFDAFRIDHILGFFRIWSIPANAVEGIMGHFVPAIPVHVSEFGERGIWFDHDRYCNPYITNEVLKEIF